MKNVTADGFPQALQTYMNCFMGEGACVPKEFFSNFELELFEFTTADVLCNFQSKHKIMFIGTYVIIKNLINKLLMRPLDNGFDSEISDVS